MIFARTGAAPLFCVSCGHQGADVCQWKGATRPHVHTLLSAPLVYPQAFFDLMRNIKDQKAGPGGKGATKKKKRRVHGVIKRIKRLFGVKV